MKLLKQILAFLILAVLFTSAYAEQSVLPPPPPALRQADRNAAAAAKAAGDPILYCDKTEVSVGETFTLSWYESDAELAYLYRYYDDGEHEGLGYYNTVTTDFTQKFSKIGKYTYYLVIQTKDGQWKYSNFVDVFVTADEDTVCSQLARRGMNNKWNLLFIVYKNVKLKGFTQSFSAAKLSAIRRQKKMIKSMMQNLSGGRIRIGTVDLIEVDEPITSVTNVGYNLPALSYGPGGDVDFNYIFDHKDITLVAVFAPLLGYKNAYDWLGLGGTYLTVNGKRVYHIIINDAYPDDEGTWTYEGITYQTISSALVHEILHCVETNSQSNGWKNFEALHDGEKNGYANTDGNYRWYKDLMRNTLDNGKYGFLKQSFYVTHSTIPENMAWGFHTDYDKVRRYYIDGIPHIIDIVIPKKTKRLESQTFYGVAGKSVYIPASVKYIAPDAFSGAVKVYGFSGSYAEDWAAAKGYTFVDVTH